MNQPGIQVTAGRGIEVLEDGEAGPVRVQLEDRAAPAAAAFHGRAVERAIRSLHQPGSGETAGRVIVEVLEDGEAGPVRVQLEHRAVAAAPATRGRAVERAVRPLDQPAIEVSAGRRIVEVLEDGEAAPVRVQLEDRAVTAASALNRCAVEGAVAPLDQSPNRVCAD